MFVNVLICNVEINVYFRSANPGGYLFYCADQMMELDLSAAEQLLHDPLERLDIDDGSKSDSTDGEIT